MDALHINHYIRPSKVRKKDGKFPIYTRINYKGEKVDISTRIFLSKEDWDPDKQSVKKEVLGSDRMNRTLHQIREKVYESEQLLKRNGEEVTADSIRDQYRGKGKIGKKLLEVYEEHNRYYEKLVKKGERTKATLYKFEAIKRFLKDFLRSEMEFQAIVLERLDQPFIERFDRYLRTERNCGNNTTVKHIRTLRTVIKFAIKNGYLHHDPFIRYDGQVRQVERQFLEKEEVKRIAEKEIKMDRLARVRDIFLFSCYTGLAYSDVQKLKMKDIYEDREGQLWLLSYRKKTGQRADIFLLPPAIPLLNKYLSRDKVSGDEQVFPTPSNQKVNAYLKEIADLCGIDKHLTFHIARHTFATTITLANGVPLETVSSQLGHRSIKQTQHYARMVNSRVASDMKKLNGLW